MHLPLIFRRASSLGSRAFLLFLIGFATCSYAADPPAEDWKLISQSSSLTIYGRTRSGSPIKEFKAVGHIDATPRAVLAVIDDTDAYPRFMPYISECRVISRDADSLISYQRVAPPFCTDRDYSIRVRHETKSTPAGEAYVCRWDLANAQGPAERTDILRVKINEGSWLIEPAAGNTSRATYCVYTDSGGSLPAWLAGKANQIGIGKLFEAVRKQVKETKYNGEKQ